MPVTSNFAIPYPDGTTSLTPLQDKFADIANAVDSALVSGLGGAPRLASSDSARNAIYPSPVQGNLVDRPDKGYIESYYALYDPSTNPGGATPAGWYPISGNMPYFRYHRTSAYTFPVADTAMVYDTLAKGVLEGATLSSGVYTVTQPGLWHIEAKATTNTANASGWIGLRINNVPYSGADTIISTTAYSTFRLTEEVPLRNGDTFSICIRASVSTAGVISDGSYNVANMSARYVGPSKA